MSNNMYRFLFDIPIFDENQNIIMILHKVVDAWAFNLVGERELQKKQASYKGRPVWLESGDILDWFSDDVGVTVYPLKHSDLKGDTNG